MTLRRIAIGLRQKLIDELQLRGYAERTVESYVAVVRNGLTQFERMESAAREIGRWLFLLRQFLILQRHPRREQLRAALSE